MKYLLLLSLLIPFTGMAQPPGDTALMKRHKVRSSIACIAQVNDPQVRQYRTVDSSIYDRQGRLSLQRTYSWYGQPGFTERRFLYNSYDQLISTLTSGTTSIRLKDSVTYDAQHRAVAQIAFIGDASLVLTDKVIAYSKKQARITDRKNPQFIKIKVREDDQHGRLKEERLYDKVVSDDSVEEKEVYQYAPWPSMAVTGKMTYRRLRGGPLLLYTEEHYMADSSYSMSRTYALNEEHKLLEEVHTSRKADSLNVIRYRTMEGRLAPCKREVILLDSRGLKTAALYYLLDPSGRERLYQEMKYEYRFN